MTETIVLKLGGSVVTDKGRTEYNLRTETVHKLLLSLKQFFTEKPISRLVLIHGAGGHIHHLAKTYALTTSCADNPTKLKHAQEVQQTCSRLSYEIASLAAEIDFPLRQIPTHEVATNSEGRFSSIDMERISKALATNTVPLLYGDMVPDAAYGLSICSGDTLITQLAPRVTATRVIYVSDIDGLYSEDPYLNPRAQLLENIAVDVLQSDSVRLSDSHNVDVTGGLAGKLKPAAELFKNTPSLRSIEICNGLKPGVLAAVLNKQPVPHTLITQ